MSERVTLLFFVYMFHQFWLWVYYNAQTIQAATAVLGLFGLVVYAFDTRRIRIATLAQSDASRRPYFQAEAWENLNKVPLFKGKDYYQFKNCGSGIALKIGWRFLNEPTAPLTLLGSCAVGSVKYLFTVDGRWIEFDEILSNDGVYLEYEDTANLRYWTTVTLKGMTDSSVHALVDTGSVSKKSLIGSFI